jgi:two-component system, NtrC family, response regulator AtoC
MSDIHPRLFIVTPDGASDAFRTLWPVLAAGCGATLICTPHLDPLTAGDDDVVVLGATGSAHKSALVDALQSRGIAVTMVADASGGANAPTFALPADQERLGAWIAAAIDQRRLAAARAKFTGAERDKYRFDDIVGASEALDAVRASVTRLIPAATKPVFLTGESGTGKTHVARTIHYQGPRQSAQLVALDCATAAEGVLQLALLGREDDTHITPGFLELARGGTLLLNGFPLLMPRLQDTVLRAMDERAIRRIGGSDWIPVDVRIFATSETAPDATPEHDVLRRAEPIRLPPLRERRDDILPLARHFIARFAVEYDRPAFALNRADASELTARDWPGNVRELRGLIERITLLATASSVRLSDALTPRAPSAEP